MRDVIFRTSSFRFNELHQRCKLCISCESPDPIASAVTAPFPTRKPSVNRWSNFPFSPARLPFFYGWIMVPASVLAILSSMPGQTSGVGVFKESLLKAWDLTSIQLATAYMLGTILSGLTLPLAGRMLDRFGTRTGIALASMGLGASLTLLSQSDRIGLAISNNIFWRIACMTACFMLIRFFGQGCLAMISRLAIGKWFNHRRGYATAIASPLTAFGFGMAPLGLGMLIATYGWREAAGFLAVGIGVFVTIIGWTLYRDTPEECGLLMDGAPPEHFAKEEISGQAAPDREFTRREATSTLAFWIYSLALGAHGLLFTAVAFHIESIGAYHGLEPAEAFGLFWPMAFTSVPCTMLSGWLSDRVDLRWLLGTFLLGQLMGIAGIYFLSYLWARPLLYVGYGIAGGLFSTIAAVSLPRFFGRRHLGAISGWNMTIMVWASALGPLFFSEVEAWSGSYQYALAGYTAVPILLLISGLFARNPQTLDRFRGIPENP